MWFSRVRCHVQFHPCIFNFRVPLLVYLGVERSGCSIFVSTLCSTGKHQLVSRCNMCIFPWLLCCADRRTFFCCGRPLILIRIGSIIVDLHEGVTR